MEKSYQFIDLSYLNEISNNSKEFMVDVISMLIEQLPEYQNSLRELYQQKKWFELGRLAHKAKSAILMVGMKEMADDLKKLEENAKQGKNIGEYQEIIVKFVSESESALQELKEIKKKL
jgi:HPt (histidine-containing phosphotransfer) domain-containing protein